MLAALALVACARHAPPAPVVGIYYTAPAKAHASAKPARQRRPSVASTRLPPHLEKVQTESLPPVKPAKTDDIVTTPAGEAQPSPTGADGTVTETRGGKVTVHAGETLFAISRREKVPIRALIDANNLQPPYHLRRGQSLRVPGVRVYRVAQGDTVYGISRRFDLGIRDIIEQNDLKGPDYGLVTGQRLVLPLAERPERVAATRRARTTPRPRHAEHPPAHAAATREAVYAPPPPPDTRPVGNPNAKPPPLSGHKFEWPLRGKIVSGFGPKGGGLYNDGINIAAKPGTIVRAAQNGVVAYAGNELRGYGNLVLLRHAHGWITAYAHNGELLVRPGEVVRRGQPIARVGDSGAVTTPQLHFELRHGRKAVNPRSHLG